MVKRLTDDLGEVALQDRFKHQPGNAHVCGLLGIDLLAEPGTQNYRDIGSERWGSALKISNASMPAVRAVT